MDRRWAGRRCRAVGAALAACIALSVVPVRAHDQSAWGGLFRTRDGGATWLSLNSGSFVSGAIALAVDPSAPERLLLATDSGLLASANGGRDWTVQASDAMVGPVFAAAYDADGSRAMVSGRSALFGSAGARWWPIASPSGAAPARALVTGSKPGTVYLAGWNGFYMSRDWGGSWVAADAGLPDEPIDAVVVDRRPPGTVWIVAGGRLWSSAADGPWREHGTGTSPRRVEVLALDDARPDRVWVIEDARLSRSDDRGGRWVPAGIPLPDPKPVSRGLVAADDMVLVATDRGLYRSPDGGHRWEAPSGSLPAHLEAGPLVRDPSSPSTVYAGFAFTPYAELWRQAAEGRSALSRLDAVNLAGGAAFLALVVAGGIAGVRRLRASHHVVPPRPHASPAGPAPGGHRS